MAYSDERAIMQRISAQPRLGGGWGFGKAKPSRRNTMNGDKGFTMESSHFQLGPGMECLGEGWHGCSKRLLESRLNELSGAGLCGFPQN